MASILIRAEGTNAARNVQRLLKKCARDWNGCAAKKIPVSSNRYFFAGRAGAMESPTRAVVEPAVRRREATKARVAPKHVVACGTYRVCHSANSHKLTTAISHLYLVVAYGYLPSLPFGKLADYQLLKNCSPVG